jgi:hypothetical protein
MKFKRKIRQKCERTKITSERNISGPHIFNSFRIKELFLKSILEYDGKTGFIQNKKSTSMSKYTSASKFVPMNTI